MIPKSEVSVPRTSTGSGLSVAPIIDIDIYVDAY